MIHVRRYVERDKPTAMRLARQMHQESPLHRAYPFSEEKVSALLEAARASQDWLAVVVCDELKPIGFALVAITPMYFSEANELVDLAMYIVPERRGGRAALLMTKFIEHWAEHRKVERILFGINTGINHEQALRFYIKMGFAPTGLQISKSVH